MTTVKKKLVNRTSAAGNISRSSKTFLLPLTVLFPCLLTCFFFYKYLDNTGKSILTSNDQKKSRGFEIYTYDKTNIVQIGHVHPTYDGANPFTQGLLFYNETHMIESGGLYGSSFLRMLTLSNYQGDTVRHHRLSANIFGEGCTLIKNNTLVVQLTWKENKLLVFSLDEFTNAFALYATYALNLPEGWGITTEYWLDNRGRPYDTSLSRVWASTGDCYLYELDVGFLYHGSTNTSPIRITRKIQLTCLNHEIYNINELEYNPIDRTVIANIFTKKYIIEFDVETGECTRIINLKGLYDVNSRAVKVHADKHNDVLNGVAWHPTLERKALPSSLTRLVVTGKRWPYLYLLTLVKIQKESDLKDFAEYDKSFE